MLFPGVFAGATVDPAREGALLEALVLLGEEEKPGFLVINPRVGTGLGRAPEGKRLFPP